MAYYRKMLVRKLFGSRRRRLLLPGMTALFLAFSAASFSKRDAISWYLGVWRAESLISKSEWAAELGDWKKATQTAVAAWQLHPGEITILRRMYEAFSGARSAEALAVGRSLFEHPQATSEDRLSVISLFLGTGDLVTVSSLFSKLRPAEREKPEALELGARFFLARNHPQGALPLIDRLRMKREEPRDLLLAAKTLSLTPSEGDLAIAESQRIIGELFRNTTDDSLAVEGFLLLSTISSAHWQGDLFEDARSRLSSLEERGTTVPARAWLLADEIEMKNHPERRQEILQAAMDRWFGLEPRLLGQWLVGQGEAKRFLDQVPRSVALERPEMVPVVTQALILENRWERALSLLERAPEGTDPVVLLSLKAMIQTQTGHVAEAKQNWIRSYRQAEMTTGRQALLRCAQLASLGNQTDLRDKALAEAISRPSSLSIAATDVAFLFPSLASQNRSDDLLQVSLGLLDSEPENPQILNNAVWLQLMKGRADEDKVKKLAENAKRFPAVNALQSTLALAQLKAGHTEDALSTLEPMKQRIEAGEAESAPTDRALVALALARAGETQRSREIANTVRWDKLLSVERQFFTAAIDEAIDDRLGLDERGIGN